MVNGRLPNDGGRKARAYNTTNNAHAAARPLAQAVFRKREKSRMSAGIIF